MLAYCQTNVCKMFDRALYLQGLMCLVIAPTIPDLRATLGFTYEEISRGLAARSAGFFVGSIVGGVLNDVWPQHSELIVSLSIIMSSTASIFIPMFASLPLFITLMFIIGIGYTIINTGE